MDLFFTKVHLEMLSMVWVAPLWSACSKNFTVEHAMNCPTGGFPTIRHNELCDFTASLLSEVCHGVSVEPLTGETFPLASANIEDGARLNVAANGFWGSCHQKVFIDVKVFNPNASSYNRGSIILPTGKGKYEQRICDVEMRCFTPPVFSTFGVCLIFVTSFSKDEPDKKDVSYSVMMSIGFVVVSV